MDREGAVIELTAEKRAEMRREWELREFNG